MKDTHRISDLSDLKLLSDPLKLSLLQAFAEGPRTTRQVADDLGEKVTKLYRHVDALHEAGLLEVVAEQPLADSVTPVTIGFEKSGLVLRNSNSSNRNCSSHVHTELGCP